AAARSSRPTGPVVLRRAPQDVRLLARFSMVLFSTLDLIALAWFLCAWVGYSMVLSSTERNKHGLNSEMNRHRLSWMRQMAGRETRMVDTQIVAALQNGTAFFASTSLIAVGGALTLVRATGEALQVVATLPFGVKST